MKELSRILLRFISLILGIEQIESFPPPLSKEEEAEAFKKMRNGDKKARSFLDAIKENGTAPVPSSQILYNQVILDYIKKSADAGRELAVEIPVL